MQRSGSGKPSMLDGLAAIQDDMNIDLGVLQVAERRWKSHQAYNRDLTSDKLASSAEGKVRRCTELSTECFAGSPTEGLATIHRQTALPLDCK